ncbi:MAG: hypothetical protein ACOY46_10435 [Bacillota bacterium]
MPDKNGIKPVSRVLLQPTGAGLSNRDKTSLHGKNMESDFQLNSLGGPLEEDFTG